MSEWIKHEAATRWCSVLRRDRGAMLTRCRGSLDACEPHEISERPLVAERCVCCQAAYAAAELDALAADCGDKSCAHTITVGLREVATAQAITFSSPYQRSPMLEAAMAELRDRYARRRGYIANRDYVPGEDW